MDTGPCMGSLDSQLPNFHLGGGRAGRGKTALQNVIRSTKGTLITHELYNNKNIQKCKIQQNKKYKKYKNYFQLDGGRAGRGRTLGGVKAHFTLNTSHMN